MLGTLLLLKSNTSILNKLILGTYGTILSAGISKSYLLSKVNNRFDNIIEKDQFPNVTILLPTLNEEWFMENTLKSIKSQNIYEKYGNKKFEILVVDSVSEDNTINIAKKYVDKIISMKERNLVKARTLGVNRSRGDIIVFIDADCLYPVNWLNYMLKYYVRDKNIVAVSGTELHPGVNKIVDIFEPISTAALNNLGHLTTNPMIGHNSSCYKWAFNDIGGFDVPFDYDIKSSKDTQLVLEKNFAEKFKSVGKYVFDPILIVYDFGGRRRFLYGNRKNMCKFDINKKISENNKYICKYWNERENKIRF